MVIGGNDRVQIESSLEEFTSLLVKRAGKISRLSARVDV